MKDAIVEAVIGKDILQSHKVTNPALFSMVAGVKVEKNTEERGRAFELAVGAELGQQPGKVFYWRERHDEVDFVYQDRDALYAIEVKSGRKKSGRGLDAFVAQVPHALRVMVTPENFDRFSADPRAFLKQVAM